MLRHALCLLGMALLLLLGAARAEARSLVADLSAHVIEIDSGFTGTDLLLFGARGDAGDIVVVIRGPEKNFIVRRKERVGGIWVNTRQVSYRDIPYFYSIASTHSLEEVKNPTLLEGLKVGIDHLHITPEEKATSAEVTEFRDAFLANRAKRDLYDDKVKEITFMGDSLFKTVVSFPDSIPRGVYTAEVYLLNDGQLVGMQSTPLSVRKRGFDAFVFDMAHRYPALYGLTAVVLAVLAGWIAGTVFKRV